MKNIILIGFMGSGKTEVGRRLAERLGYRFVDTDSIIEDKTGKSINEIFNEEGEPYFRKLEKEVIRDLRCVQQYVISTGGGLGANRENLQILKSVGLVIWLKVSPHKVLERVGTQTHRPLLNVKDQRAAIEELLSLREPIYKEADLIIDTDNLTPEEVVDRILAYIHGKG